MGLKVVTPPAVEPVTLAGAKAHLRLDTDADDTYVSALIAAARERVELFLRRALIIQTLEYTMDGFPAGGIDLPRPPLQSVEWIKCLDTAGVLQMRPEDYIVDVSSNEMGRNHCLGASRQNYAGHKARITRILRNAIDELIKTLPSEITEVTGSQQNS